MIKGKRTKRPRLSSPLELTTATTSSSSTAAAGGVSHVMSHGVSDRKNPSLSDSASELTHDDEEDMANCLILLAKGHTQRTMSPQTSLPPAGEVYQCKTCSKSFASFQALGGHRASHKKPSNKPFLTLGDQREIKQEHFQSIQRSTILSLQITNKITRVHECSLCGAEFASGQALGGHMRRHRPILAAAAICGSSQMDESTHREVRRERNMLLSLDLNMPAPEEDQPAESKFAFAPKEQVIVFSTTPLIDCHY